MALESGSRLGSYEISDLLGKGGMGEVVIKVLDRNVSIRRGRP